MRTTYDMKHPRGSSPPPTQSEHDLYGDDSLSPPIEQHHIIPRSELSGKVTAGESSPLKQPGADGIWKDDGGEGG